MSLFPFNVIYASSIPGVVLDCVVNPNLPNVGKTAAGGTPTDNTVAINNALLSLAATGTGPIKLILDGGTACSGITLPTAGYCEIEGIGWNSGIWVNSGSNADALNNGKITPFDPQGPAPARNGYVRLSNFTINGNRGDGTTGNSNSGNPRGPTSPNYWLCNVTLWNLEGVHIENMFLYDSPSYGIRLLNCGDVVVEECTITNPNTTAGFNNDCVHIDGPSEDVRVAFNKLNNNSSDDGVALNASEGYGGAINRAVVIGNTFNQTYTAVRIYGANYTATNGNSINAPVYTAVVSGNSGTVRSSAIVIGVATATYNQDISGQVLTFSDNTFTVTNGPFFNLTGNVGDIVVANCVLNAPVVAAPFIQGTFATTKVSNLTVSNCGIYRSTSGSTTSTPLVSATQALTITRLTIDNFQIVNEAGQSYAAVAALLAMTNVTITNLYVAALDYTNITALADSYTNITNLYGAYQPETNQQSVTTAYTALVQDRVIFGNTTSAGFAVTLPAKAYKGQKLTLKNTGTANSLTVTGTIDGSANPTLASLAKMTIEYDGANWWGV